MVRSDRPERWCARIAAGLVACALLACGGQEHAAPDALTVLLPREAQELDPRLTGDAYGHKLSRLLFASLVTIDETTLEPKLELAQAVERLDPVTYRVTLAAGLRFSDGSALDADDVRATFESVAAPELGSRYAQTYRRVARIDVEDPLTLRFVLREPHATFITDLELPIVRAEDRARPLGAIGSPAPVSSGPYVLASREAARVELVANPHWRGGIAKHDRLRFVVVRDDNTRALRMLAGAGDVALNAIPALLWPMFERDARFKVQSAHGVGTTYVGLNLDSERMRSAKVRHALAYALDRDALIRGKLEGRAVLANSFVVPGHWAELHEPGFAYDPMRAEALLDAAGLRRDAHGVRLRFSLRCGSDRARVSIARALAAMWHEVGVEVDIRPTETATMLANMNRGQFEAALLQIPEVVEPHVLSWFFGSDHVPEAGREGANRWRIRSPELDAALERGRTHVERAERIEAYTKAQRILARELPVIPLWHEDVVAITSRRAADFVPSRLGRFNPIAVP